MTLWLILILIASALAPLFWFRDFFSRLTFSEDPERFGRELRTLIPTGTSAKKAASLLRRNGFEIKPASDDSISAERVWRKQDGSAWKIEVVLRIRESGIVGSRASVNRLPKTG